MGRAGQCHSLSETKSWKPLTFWLVASEVVQKRESSEMYSVGGDRWHVGQSVKCVGLMQPQRVVVAAECVRCDGPRQETGQGEDASACRSCAGSLWLRPPRFHTPNGGLVARGHLSRSGLAQRGALSQWAVVVRQSNSGVD